ncbi:MAG: HemK2/MTQ2 family protein methyltransferase [Candidatus Nanoarchaeia archaeon]
MIYKPAEDSYFLASFLDNLLTNSSNLTYLDMGCGSCILAETAAKYLSKKNIITADINPEACQLAKKKGFKTIQTDLFINIKDKFDLITFNAPYLPSSKYDKQVDTTGGKQGDETALRFIKQVKNHLNKNGKAYLLVSSKTPLNKINKHAKIVDSKKLFFEELYIYEVAALVNSYNHQREN